MRKIIIVFFVGIAPLLAQGADPALRRSFDEGDRALAEKRYAEAERAYDKVLRMAPGSAEVYAKLGLAYYQQGKYEQAVPILRQALKLKPGLPKADILLVMSLSELGRYKEALPGLDRAFRHTTDAPLKRMTGLQLQRTYTALGQDQKAVEVALELNRLYADDPEVLYHTARLFGNFAFLTMRRLADVAPDSSWRHQAAGEVHESQGNYELAAAEYRQVLAADPRRPGLHLRIGRVLRLARQGDFEADAAREFAQELQADPSNANAAYELGEIRRRERQFAIAEELFERALKYDPDFQEAHVGVARVLLALNKPEAALDHLKRAITLIPDDAAEYFFIAQVYKALGNSSEQQRALTQFRQMREQALQRQQIGPRLSARDVTKQEVDPNATQ